MSTALHLLCAGAAKGLVGALAPGFLAQTGAIVDGRFGAVGAMQEALLSGAPCDLIVVTDRMIDALSAAGRVRGDARAPLGRVRTGIAVRRGEPRPDIASEPALQAALLAADAIHFPDPARATAGIHFANVLRELGIDDALQPRLRTHPNGAAAMREMAAQAAPRQIGCTQITEIMYSEGVELVGPLPGRFELATVYSAAVAAQAASPELALCFLQMLCGSDAQALREAGGFEKSADAA